MELKAKTVTVAVLVTAAALFLAACGDDDNSMHSMPGTGSSTAPPSTGDAMSDVNDADVTFATEMIPHHRQAVEMAKLAGARAMRTEVKDLAIEILNAQDPEIQTMTGWLVDWGEPVPEDMPGMDMSSAMPGMMSHDDLDKLMSASGADFDQMFLTMMIAHHQAAVEMARTEQTDGKNADAIALAAQIEQAQTAEIATMQGLSN